MRRRLFCRQFVPTFLSNLSQIIFCVTKDILQTICPFLPIKFVQNHFLLYKDYFADTLSLPPYQICHKSFLAIKRLFCRQFVPTSLSNLSQIISCITKVILQTICCFLLIKICSKLFLVLKRLLCRQFIPTSISNLSQIKTVCLLLSIKFVHRFLLAAGRPRGFWPGQAPYLIISC